MRTTVTLDDDVAAALHRAARERETSFKAVLNDAVRAGLRPRAEPAERYELPTFSLGARPGVDFTKAVALAAGLEDQETMRKLELRK